MRKRGIEMGAIILLSLCLVSCSTEYEFDFAYETIENEWHRDTRNEIMATVINGSDKDYQYEGSSSGFRADVRLYCEVDGVVYEISYEELTITTDVGTHIIKGGEACTTTFYFDIPTDAVLGEYDLEISYMDSKEIFENVITIVE